MLLKRAKPGAVFLKKYRLKYFFYSNWKQFQVFKIAKFEFKVIVHYGLWAKCTQLWPLKGVLHLWPILWLFMHFSQKLQHIGDK